MPIAITPEHEDLADSVQSPVPRIALSEVLHRALETPIATPPPHRRPAADQGLHGVHLAESVGGQGFGIVEHAVVLPSSAAAPCRVRSSLRRSPGG